jgi:hypothetical protein
MNRNLISQYRKMERTQKMSKRQSEAMYERMMNQENSRVDRLASTKLRVIQ